MHHKYGFKIKCYNTTCYLIYCNTVIILQVVILDINKTHLGMHEMFEHVHIFMYTLFAVRNMNADRIFCLEYWTRLF